MGKPLIGISGNIMIMEQGSFPGMKKTYANHDYIESVQQAGGIPIVLPWIKEKDDIAAALKHVDGIVLSGGYDIDPTLYGEEPIPQLGFVYREIDEFYIKLLLCAKELHKPVLGICKGIQAMNVAFQGSLYQDIHSQRTKTLQHDQQTPTHAGSHTVIIEPDSFLSAVLPQQLLVNSFHHQAVKTVAPGFTVAAMAKDGVIEAIECMENGCFIGVQWHPEMMAVHGDKAMQSLFLAFMNQVKNNINTENTETFQ